MTCRTKLLSVASLVGLMTLPAAAGQHCVTCIGPAATYLCEAQNGPGILAANGGQLACITELAKRGGHDSCSVVRRAAAQCEGLAPTVLYPGASGPDVTAADRAPVPPPSTVDPGVTTARSNRPNNQQSDPANGPANSATDTFTPVDGDPYVDGNTPVDGNAQARSENAKAAPKGPPKTVAEMADRAFEDSKKGLGKAGEAVGDTAKSAGNVVTDTAKKTGEQIGKAGKAVGNAASKTWKCVTSLFSNC